MGLVHRVAFTAVCALLACVTHSIHIGPFHLLDRSIAADLNLDIDYVMSSPNQCGTLRLRRNGMIYSHQRMYEARRELGMSLKELNKTMSYMYPDDINCNISVCVGTGWRVQLVFPMGMQLACATDLSSCDCIEVYDGPSADAPLLKIICGHHDVVEPIATTSSDFMVHFKTDRNCQTSLGFQIKWYAFRFNDDMPCTNEEFLCDKNRCIPKYFLCDDTYHCLDKTDEGSTGCSKEQRICRIVSILARYTGLLVFLLVLLILILVLGVILCLYNVVRMRRNQVACTRVLALQGGRKSDDEEGKEVVVSRPAGSSLPTRHTVVTSSVGRQSQRVLCQPGYVRNSQVEL